jgi:transposase
MQAIPGGTTQTDTLDAQTIAGLLRGGRRPPAAVSPAAMRATRARRRRRPPGRRQRAEGRAPLPTPHRPYTLPESGKQSAAKANRDGGAERFPAPAVPQRLAVDLALLGHDDERRRDVERSIRQTAQPPQAQPLSLLRTVPGIGELRSGGRLSAIHELTRFPRLPECLASCRLGPCPQESAGKRDGTAGTQSGHAQRTWAGSAAAGLVLRATPAGPKSLPTREHTPGSGPALPRWGPQLGRRVSSR